MSPWNLSRALQSMEVKYCQGCSMLAPISYYERNQKKDTVYFSKYCKFCRNEKQAKKHAKLSIVSKKCGYCNQEKPVSEFSRSIRDNTGFQSYCNLCKFYISKGAPLPRKQCGKCKKFKLHEDFYEARTSDGLFSDCKDCCRTNKPAKNAPAELFEHYSDYIKA